MKKLIAISLALNAALLSWVGWKELTAHAVGGGDVPAGNGDVNADTKIDISDVVYLVNALYLGGPAPEPIDCPPPAVKGLPATGQTECYDNVDEITCGSADFPGQDGFYQAGCPSEGRFVDNGAGR